MPEELDVKKMILDELKGEGLDLAEDLAIGVCKAVFRVMPKVAAATDNKYDDLLIPVVGVLEPKIMEMLDKIDKKEG